MGLPPMCCEMARQSPSQTLLTTAEPISNSSYNFGAVVELECIDGYKVVGVTSIYCNQEFDWSGELGTCESKQKFILISACLFCLYFLSLLSVLPIECACSVLNLHEVC